MTDKYTLQEITDWDEFFRAALKVTKRCKDYALYNHDKLIGRVSGPLDTANLLDKCLNQTSRAGSKTSQAKRDAAKRNIAKRWGK